MLVDRRGGLRRVAAGRRRRARSVKLKRAEELNAQHGAQHRGSSPKTSSAGSRASPTPETLKRQYYAMRDLLARYRALREDHLRYLVKCGLIQAGRCAPTPTRSSRFPTCAVIKQANDELERRRVVPERRAHADGVAPRPARVRLPARGGAREDHRRCGGPIGRARAGRRAGAAAARDTALAEEYFRAGSALDDGERARRSRTRPRRTARPSSSIRTSSPR